MRSVSRGCLPKVHSLIGDMRQAYLCKPDAYVAYAGQRVLQPVPLPSYGSTPLVSSESREAQPRTMEPIGRSSQAPRL